MAGGGVQKYDGSMMPMLSFFILFRKGLADVLCNDGEYWSHCSKIQGIFIYMDNWYVHPLVTVVVTQKLHITYSWRG